MVESPPVAHASFTIGDVVRHRMFDFRGVIFDVDPVFANSEDWYNAIPAEVRPHRDQPFYHLLAENGDSSYVDMSASRTCSAMARPGRSSIPR